MIDDLDATSPRGALAIRLREAVLDRWRAEVLAIGLCGSMAHGDDSDSSDVNLVVVTSRARTGPKPVRRLVDGIPVDLRVFTAEDGMGQARLLAPMWPLLADAFITTFPLLDAHNWFKDRREAHLMLLTEARPMEFTGLARHNWAVASGAHARAVRHAQRYDTDAASMMMAEARLYAAMVAGFLTRTYFRNTADAVRHTGVAAAGTRELEAILKYQAEELTARGRPVDGRLGALFD
ncbi:nucleotidyltransferase domain-containing protein [Actinoplanes couchii]|uniref:nucleotidyltransferase domain-containing protein n=1 Tax=Actinoplanes couchii TaxID=403638 RepID=UPI001EF1A2A2|nr:nucleotidyltransferase domain-containing protein [Actinoplanes couchii]MDR6325630.1 putative nucleotidyltransferase [Actinoplanes couchii]